MLAILGPRSINEKKFTRWSTRLRALGLDWDTDLRSVSMPEEKIAKALLRVQAMLRYKSATRTELCKLLGSLRHVRSCIRSAKPLFQRIASLHRRAPRWGKITISEGAILDLQWFQHILQQGRLCSVPLKFFGDLPAPDVQLYMDASDSGHCALHPAKCEYIRLQFDDKERLLIRQGRLSINIREQLGAVLALLCWGREWCPRTTSEVIHVRCWIDNRSAVAWCNNLNSREPLSQELNRVLGSIEAQWALHVSAEHLPGAVNTMADLGSRAWDGHRLTKWKLLTKTWTQIPISNAIRKSYSAKWSAFNNAPSLNHLNVNTKEPGSSGKVL
ncbi:hypothetical protein F441_00146 [Phytophthora nicotianae CJ01A1]|uniref:RNase H type-1 domain-containing protein n=2 Tax=Phytophthora nicotianae TaxID=4792 RepID=W2XXV5_PHYNI|nr:hypothetical protein L916_00136 [Phytophthora nicotianae]ETP27352.1 hypothetical protein F441_00146 [Phytophthora nicotianae CJ01A1]